jgi:hypothetical protein
MSPNFETAAEVRQGDALSTLLLNLCMEKVIRNVQTNTGATTFNRRRHDLLYADDVVVLGHALKHIAETTEDMTTVASQIGLTIKASKIKYMINRNKNGNEPEEIETN